MEGQTNRGDENGGIDMLLVEPKKNPGLAGRIADWLTRRRVGRTMEPVRIAQHHPRFLFAMGGFEQALDGASALDERLRALVNVKAASVVNCSFCLDIGSSEARKQGVRVDELLALSDHARSDLFSARDKLALDYAAALSRSPAVLEADLMRRLRAEFSERELVELNYVIAWENFRARSNTGLGVGPAGFTHESRRARPESVGAGA